MIQINIVTQEISRQPIPLVVRGLAVVTLQNLQTEGPQPVPEEVKDLEFWPEVNAEQTLGWNKKFGDEILSAEPVSKTVLISRQIVNMSAAEKKEVLAAAKKIKLDEMLEHARVKQEATFVETVRAEKAGTVNALDSAKTVAEIEAIDVT